MHRQLLTNTLGAVVGYTFPQEMCGVAYDCRYGIVLIFLLIVTDFYTGLHESFNKHQEFRLSRAGRRTMAKLFEYISAMLIGAFLGKAVLEPWGVCTHEQAGAIALGLCAVWELDSILGHLFYIHNITTTFSVKRLLVFLFVYTTTKDFGRAKTEAFKIKDNGKSSTFGE